MQQRERKAAKTERKVQHEKRRKCEKVYEEWLTDKASKQAASAQRESSALKEKLKEIEKVDCLTTVLKRLAQVEI